MKFNHKKVYTNIATIFDISFKKESNYPSNYTCFYRKGENDSFMRIENIPKSKKYMKIAYVMFDEENEMNKTLYYELIEQYKKQRENIGISMQIDNNSVFDSVMV